MNRINPKKLLNSKWTALKPVRREKHFLVTGVEFDEDGAVIHCEIEAVITKRVEAIDWRTLKDPTTWGFGWQ
ncbi:MAG: TIGR02450 family Trp-rich protein [Gammaproteobacteria bacterium]